jgi:hypothetical protein
MPPLQPAEMALFNSGDLNHIRLLEGALSSHAICEVDVQQPTQVRAVERLAVAGEKAGFSVEDMIRMLNAGVSVEPLLDIIDRSLQAPREGTGRTSRWII